MKVMGEFIYQPWILMIQPINRVFITNQQSLKNIYLFQLTNMKAYMNKFRAPGIHKPPSSKSNQNKNQKQLTNISSSTIQSPECSKNTEMKNQIPTVKKVQKNILPTQNILIEKSILTNEQKISKQPTILPPNHSLFSEQTKSQPYQQPVKQQQLNQQKTKRQEPEILPSSQSLFSNLPKLKQNKGPLPPKHSLFCNYLQENQQSNTKPHQKSFFNNQPQINQKEQTKIKSQQEQPLTNSQQESKQHTPTNQQSLFGSIPVVDYGQLSKSLFGNSQSLFSYEPNTKEQPNKSEQKLALSKRQYSLDSESCTVRQRYTYSDIYDIVTQKIMRQILSRNQIQQSQPTSPNQSNQQQALLAELQSLKANTPKDQPKTLNSIQCLTMTHQIYQQLPLQTHVGAVRSKFVQQVKTVLMKILPKIIQSSVQNQLTEEIKKRSQKVQNLVKLTHNYLKKHGSLPDVKKVNLQPLKVKFECEIPLQMIFRQGDFGQLVNRQNVSFQKFK